MKPLHRALEDYLATRRALGFKLEREGKLLPGFIDYLVEGGSTTVTTTAAVAWATRPQNAHPAWWASRLSMIRGFAKYLQTLDPRTEVPPLELLPHRRPRSAPYIYSGADIAGLRLAAQTLRSPLKAATYSTLIGLLAVTGLRVSEAIALDDSDVDRRSAVALIRTSKFRKTREVALHRTTVQALARYTRERDRFAPRRKSPSLFVSTVGKRLIYNNVHETFLRLVYAAGLADRRPRRPRIHDLRHTFAIQTVLGWYRAGDDVEAKMPLLSTYLGHIGPSATYWYLSAVPELLEAATVRLERALKVRS